MSARYDAMAAFYDEAVGDDVTDASTAALLALAGDVDGLRVLDVACGQGRIARALARAGAAVVGIDLSAALLDLAVAAEQAAPLGIDYRTADVRQPGVLAGERFDAVVCNQALADIDDLDPALALVARVLPAGGAFTFSLLHPCFPGFGPTAPSSWSPEGYYHEGWWLADNPGFRGKVGANHRKLSTYLNALRRHGFVLDDVREPPPGAQLEARLPGAAAVPWFLVARCRKES
jgi:ubiquinone/menaquinone biosynthesis C-methylase UbiE